MSALDAVATWLLDTSWQVGLLILGVLVFERVFGRLLAPRWRYALWLLVVVRLAWPAPLPAPGGLPSWEQLTASPARSGAETVDEQPTRADHPTNHVDVVPRADGSLSPVDTAERTARILVAERASPQRSNESPRVESDVTEPNAARDPRRLAATPSSEVVVLTPPALRAPPRAAGSVVPAVSPATRPARATQEPAPARPTPSTRVANTGPSVQTAVLSLWAAVALALLARSTVHELRFRRALRHAHPVTDARFRALLADAADALDVRRPIDVVRTDLVSAPAVHGLRHVRLLVPTSMPAGFDDRAWGCVLRHELAHVAAHDMALGLVVTVLRHVFWFHPLVALAARRLSLTQEALRDWQAIAAAPGLEPGLHGHTLLTLAEHTTPSAPTAITAGLLSRRTLQERIHMIARHRPSSPRNAALGLALLLPLGWAGVTVAPAAVDPGAATTAGFVAPASPGSNDGRPVARDQRVRVERHRPEAAWRAALAEQLTRPVHVAVEDAPVDAVLDLIREQTGLNLVTRQDLLHDYGNPVVTLGFDSIPAGDLLDLICGHVGGLDHTMARGVVYLGEQGELPATAELRLYTAPDLFDTHWDDDHEILELIMEYGSDRDSWHMLPEVSMEIFDDLLVVSQTPDNHTRIEAFLERLLRGGHALDARAPAWRAELDAALATTTSIDHDGTLGEYAEMLGRVHGLNILVDEGFADEDVTLQLRDVPLRLVLDWLAAFTGLSVVLEHGAVRLTEERTTTLEMHPVADLLKTWDEDELSQLVEQHVDPESWYDDEDVQQSFWRELLVVRQSEAAQAAIVDLLEALRRAETD